MPDVELPDARHALLARLIDHAPTFPPASLPPEEALAEDRRALESPHAFMLARLVWPASSPESLPTGRAVSLVLDGEPTGAPDAVEARYRDGLGELAGIADEVYVELPVDEALPSRLDEVASHGFHAKIRCGGAAVPTAAELARFVRMCRERELAFKATAGLHHAVATNGEHGFVNLLAAAVFEGAEEAALAERDVAAFELTEAKFSWRDRTVGPEQLAHTRAGLLHSIGSCSFFEPVEELEALGMLSR